MPSCNLVSHPLHSTLAKNLCFLHETTVYMISDIYSENCIRKLHAQFQYSMKINTGFRVLNI